MSASGPAAEQRDSAAAGRDAAAAERDVEGAGFSNPAQERADRALAAQDRAAAASDRKDAARRALAADARDAAAEARDQAASRTDVARRASEDRHAAARDREAAARDRSAAADDRDDATAELEEAYRDTLTGAYVRRAGTELLEIALDRAQRDGRGLTVLFVDVDHLKAINDEGGHAAGDRVLAAVGAALHQGLRSYDTVVRYGGDEFVCALPGVSQAGAERRVHELQGILGRSGTGATISVGYGEVAEGDDRGELVARADRDLYARRQAARRPLSQP